jgi:microcompartment protein CcmL/EutN
VQKKKRHGAIALLEFESVGAGILASDLMVKRSPIALLRCGSIHPGRFLILVGGSVASTEEAYAAGLQVGESRGALGGSVFLGDVHPSLHDAVLGTRRDLEGDALAVVETHSSPALLAAVDAAVKSTPVILSEVRLGDDLGGHALALMSGNLFDVETALDICSERAGDRLLAGTLLPRLDADLRSLLDEGTRFGPCSAWEPSGAEYPEEVVCSWDA